MPVRFRLNRGPVTPDGTSHVFAHWPAFLLPRDTSGGQGQRDIHTLADHLSGNSGSCLPCLDGPASAGETELAGFAEKSLGFPVVLAWFEMEIGEGAQKSAEPACCVTRQG